MPVLPARARAIALNLLLSLISLLLFVGLAEGVARLFESDEERPHVADYIANWDEWDDEFFTALDWHGTGHYNRDGLRDRQHAVAKLPGYRRIMCLGDSTTFGQHLEPHEAWPQALQALLDTRGAEAEVFNVALSGWSARQQLIAYRRICRKYAPDHVLLGICLNDVGDMQNNLTRPPTWLGQLFKRSAMVRRVVDAHGHEIRSVRELFEAPELARVSRGYGLLFEEIRSLAEEVRADGATLSLVVFPFRFQLEDGAPPPRPQDRLAAFAADEGLPFLDVLPRFMEIGREAFYCEHHFGAQGARIVAEEVLDAGLVGDAGTSRQPRPVRGVDELLVALGSEDAAERSSAALELGRVAQPAIGERVAAALVGLFDDADENVRLRAAEALERHGVDGSLVAMLTGIVRDPEAISRDRAAHLLGTSGAEATPAVPALIGALEDARPLVRREAAWALGRIGAGARAAVTPLVRALADDGDDGVVEEAAEALGRIGPEAAGGVPALTTALEDERSDVRRMAARALGRIGLPAHTAAPALMRALADPRPPVRLMAARALPRVVGNPADAMAAVEARLEVEGEDDVRQELEAARRKLRRQGAGG